MLKYKAIMLEKGLAEATVNRRLAALRSLVTFARRIGRADFTLGDIEGEKIQSYRDTSGPSMDQVKIMLQLPNREKQWECGQSAEAEPAQQD